MLNRTFTPEPCSELQEAVLRARILGAMAREVERRRPFWIAGVPEEIDLAAARKAVARFLDCPVEAVTAVLSETIPDKE